MVWPREPAAVLGFTGFTGASASADPALPLPPAPVTVTQTVTVAPEAAAANAVPAAGQVAAAARDPRRLPARWPPFRKPPLP